MSISTSNTKAGIETKETKETKPKKADPLTKLPAKSMAEWRDYIYTLNENSDEDAFWKVPEAFRDSSFWYKFISAVEIDDLSIIPKAILEDKTNETSHRKIWENIINNDIRHLKSVPRSTLTELMIVKSLITSDRRCGLLLWVPTDYKKCIAVENVALLRCSCNIGIALTDEEREYIVGITSPNPYCTRPWAANVSHKFWTEEDAKEAHAEWRIDNKKAKDAKKAKKAAREAKKERRAMRIVSGEESESYGYDSDGNCLSCAEREPSSDDEHLIYKASF